MTFTVTEVESGPCAYCGTGTRTVLPDFAVCAPCWTAFGFPFDVEPPPAHQTHCKCKGSGQVVKDHRQVDCDGISKSERAWMERDAREAGTESRVPHPDKHAEKMLLAASGCSTAIRNATAAIPPPQRSEIGSRRSLGPSDPTGSRFVATIETVEEAFVRLGHILDDCRLCSDNDYRRSCNSNKDLTLAALTGNDYTELADTLAGGTSAASPRAVGQVTAQVDTAFAIAKRQVVDIWNDMHRSGAESDVLRDYTRQIVEVTSRLKRISSGQLAQWLPGPSVRLCKNEGCRRPAPILRDIALERGGAQCRRCLDDRSEKKPAG